MLIVGESTQQALLSTDFSVINAFVVIATMIALERAFSVVKHRWPAIDRALEGSPLILIDKGHIFQDRMDREHVGLGDVLAAARERHGISDLDDIEYAVLERSGGISIVLKQQARN